MTSPDPSAPAPHAPDPNARAREAAWVSSTYFAEGLPYALVNNVADVMFTTMGASLGTIGLTSLFHMPWNLKFLWGPALDSYETKRRWLWLTEALLAALVLVLALTSGWGLGLGVASAVFVAVAFAAATHDVAVDGYYLEALDDDGQSRYVGLRVTGYRVAMLAGFGGFLIVAGAIGWPLAWVVAAAVLLALSIGHARLLPSPEVRKKPASLLARNLIRPRFLIGIAIVAALAALERSVGVLGGAFDHASWWAVSNTTWVAKISTSGWIGLALLALLIVTLMFLPTIKRRLATRDSDFARAYVSFLAQPDISRALAFVILFRLGESFLLKMRTPFLLNEVAMSQSSYGLLNATLGVVASILASVVGGLLIAKHGLRRWIWPFVLAQNGLNLLYMGVALAPDPAQTSTEVLALVIIGENLGAGLGTAVFMVYIMRCCDPSHRAAHMAIVSALMSVGFTLAGVTSGFLAEAIGYAPYFAFTFVATIPMMALIPFVPHLDRAPAAKSTS